MATLTPHSAAPSGSSRPPVPSRRFGGPRRARLLGGRRPDGLVALALAAGLVLTGCSGGIGGGDSTSSGGGAAVVEPGQDSTTGSGGGGEGGDTERPFAPEFLDRQLITTAEISVRSQDVTRDADRAALLVRTAGGRISGDVRGGAEASQTADLVLRVPPAEVDGILSRLGDLGEELSRSVSSEDVTTVVADVDSRVDSLQASLDRLRGLIADATDITDLVALERELTTRETDLESLQAQQRALRDQVALATVSLHLLATPAEDPEQSSGFLSGLSGGWNAFVTVGAALLTAFGAVLPFLALLAVLLAAALLIRRRRSAGPISPEGQPTG